VECDTKAVNGHDNARYFSITLKIDLELIEVQTGSYLGEDDIERIEDDYHRS
jgi:mannose-6-phosphate isomerase-like protein (cupin superfamily)